GENPFGARLHPRSPMRKLHRCGIPALMTSSQRLTGPGAQPSRSAQKAVAMANLLASAITTPPDPPAPAEPGSEQTGRQQCRRGGLRHRQVALPQSSDLALREPTAAERTIRSYRAAGQAEGAPPREPPDTVKDRIEIDAQ